MRGLRIQSRILPVVLYIIVVIAASVLACEPAAGADAILYEFIPHGGAAVWSSTGGSVNFGGDFLDDKGQAAAITGALEDGAAWEYLSMRPPATGAAPLFLEGVFSGVAIPTTATLVRFESRVGFADEAADSTGVDFSVWVQPAPGSEFYQLSTSRAQNDGVLTPLCVDLTAYKGKTISLKLRVEAGENVLGDWGAWTAPRIVSHGETLYDFVANAGQSTDWLNGAGHVLPFGTLDATEGGALVAAYTGEDGRPYATPPPLRTQPDSVAGAPSHYLRGKFPSVSLATSCSRIKVIARVGFKRGAAGSDGVTFELQRDTPGGQVSLGSVLGVYDDRFDYLAVDLTAFKGQTQDFFLKVNAGASSISDDALWTEAKIVGYEPTELHDFIGNARLASWSTGAGGILFPSALSEDGSVSTATATLEDGVSYPGHLQTRPNTGADGTDRFIMGRYDNVIIPSNATNVRFKAAVGLPEGGASSDSATFQVSVWRRGKTDVFGESFQTRNGAVGEMDVNLTGFQGQNVSVILTAKPGAAATDVAACWVRPRLIAELPMQILAADAGAVANDSADDLPALNRAVELAKAASPSEIHFQTGDYHLHGLLTINGGTNINLRGSAGGATNVIQTDPASGVILSYNSDNVCLRNFYVDYAPMPSTQGVVGNVVTGANASVDFTVDPGFPELDQDFFTREWSLSPGGLRMVFHNPDPPYLVPDAVYDFVDLTAVTKLGPGLYRCGVNRIDGVAAGMRAHVNVFSQALSSLAAYNTRKSEGHFAWDNVTIYSARIQSFVGSCVRKVFFRNCSVLRKPNTARIGNFAAGSFIVAACAMGPDVVDCVVEGTSDDATNFWSHAYQIVEADASLTSLTVDVGGDYLSVGDHLTLYRATTGNLGNQVRITALNGTKGVFDPRRGWTVTCYLVTVDQPPKSDLQAGWDKDVFYHAEYGNRGWLVTGCAFRDFRGSGVLAAASDGLAAHNTLTNVNGPGVWLGFYPDAINGFRADGVTIEHNTLLHCVYTKFPTDQHDWAPIRVVGQKTAANNLPAVSASILNKGVTIRDNVVTDWPRHAIYVCSSEDVLIENNTLTNTAAGTKSSSAIRPVMMFDNVANITVRNNSIVDQRPAAGITGKLIAMDNSASEVTASGNTYGGNLPWWIPELMTASGYTGAAPAANFTASPAWGPPPLDVSFADASTGAQGWGWDFESDGAVDSSARNPSHAYEIGGIYDVTLLAANPYGLGSLVRPACVVAGRMTTQTLSSDGALDGFVLESSETSNVGGSITNANWGDALRVGDEANRRQVRTIVSFDTSGLPASCTLVSATLKLKRSGTTGVCPFDWEPAPLLYADVDSAFSGNTALQTQDFEDAPVVSQAVVLSQPANRDEWAAGALTAAALAAINTSGLTQFRVYLSRDDNDDAVRDHCGFYPGEFATPENAPVLEIILYDPSAQPPARTAASSWRLFE